MSTPSTVAAAIAGLGLLAAGCGGSTATQSGGPSSEAARVNGVIAFSRCMRSHGVQTYPDPTIPGVPPKKSLQQLRVGSSEFQTAQSACQSLLVNGGRPTAAQVQHYRSTMLRYARCIRAHGVANMPDPDSRGHLDIGPGTDVDVNSPQFQAAYRVCKKDLSP